MPYELTQTEMVIEGELTNDFPPIEIAKTYAMASASSYPTDWKAVDDMIREKFGENGLARIKRLAQSGDCFYI
jgi:hypothetical protein